MKVAEHILCNLPDTVLGHSREHSISKISNDQLSYSHGSRENLPELIETESPSSSDAIAQQGGGDEGDHSNLGSVQVQGLAGVETVHYGAEDEGNCGVEQFGRDEDTEGSQNSFSDLGFVCRPDVGGETLQYNEVQCQQVS